MSLSPSPSRPTIAIAISFLVGGVGVACGGREDHSPSSSSSSSSGSSGAPSSVIAPGTTTALECDASAVPNAKDIAVSNDDVNGYPPYAVAECSLAYVSSAGDLVLRDLATAEEINLAPATQHPRRPSIGVDVDDARKLVITWEEMVAGKPTVRVRYGDRTVSMSGDFTMSGEPRAHGRFVVFTAWKGPKETDDTDVYLYDARTGHLPRMAIGGTAQQRFADVSDTHVVATDFTEDPDGHFDRESDLADITIFEIATARTSKRLAPNKQAFPMLGQNGALAYLEWTSVHPQPKLESYDLKAGTLDAAYAGDRLIAHVDYVSSEPARPAFGINNTLEWIANPDVTANVNVTVLYRAPSNGSSAPALVGGLDNLLLYPPATRVAANGTHAFTVLAAVDPERSSQRTPTLRTIEH